MGRTKVDVDVWNNKMDNAENAESTLQQIRTDLRITHNVCNPYLVSSRHIEKYDMKQLVRDAFPGMEKHMDAIEFMFGSPGSQGGWTDAWALPSQLSPIINGIQGQWMDRHDGAVWLIDGDQAHVTLTDQRTGVVTLVERDNGRVSCMDDWHIDLDAVNKAYGSGELRWMPSDLTLKPLVWGLLA